MSLLFRILLKLKFKKKRQYPFERDKKNDKIVFVEINLLRKLNKKNLTASLLLFFLTSLKN